MLEDKETSCTRRSFILLIKWQPNYITVQQHCCTSAVRTAPLSFTCHDSKMASFHANGASLYPEDTQPSASDSESLTCWSDPYNRRPTVINISRHPSLSFLYCLRVIWRINNNSWKNKIKQGLSCIYNLRLLKLICFWFLLRFLLHGSIFLPLPFLAY